MAHFVESNGCVVVADVRAGYDVAPLHESDDWGNRAPWSIATGWRWPT